MKEIKITKEQLLCLIAGCLLAAFSLVMRDEDILIQSGEGVRIERPGYGENETGVELEIKSTSGDSDWFLVPVSEQIYTPLEAQELFAAMDEDVLKTMLGENTGTEEIRSDLCFPASLEKYPGVRLTWSTDDGSLIGTDGQVDNAALPEAREATVFLRSSASGQKRELQIPVKILPAPERAVNASWQERVEAALRQADEGTRSQQYLALPGYLGEERLSYRTKKDLSFLLFPALGLACAVLLALRPGEEARKRKKERETQLLVDYSEIISKLIVYIGAGLTVRNAFHQLAESARNASPRAVYEEIRTADQELMNGEPESEVYLRFARRCDLKCYVRMVSLLEQNRKTGDSSLLTALELEMGDAFEQRKNVARRLGEEAGTRLLAPLMISLVTVLVIVVVPALTKMG